MISCHLRTMLSFKSTARICIPTQGQLSSQDRANMHCDFPLHPGSNQDLMMAMYVLPNGRDSRNAWSGKPRGHIISRPRRGSCAATAVAEGKASKSDPVASSSQDHECEGGIEEEEPPPCWTRGRGRRRGRSPKGCREDPVDAEDEVGV